MYSNNGENEFYKWYERNYGIPRKGFDRNYNEKFYSLINKCPKCGGKTLIKYRWTDAWLLAAIANVNQEHPAELWEIIAEGDSLNHALFTEEEIESGLVRLTEGGWITEQDSKFIVTDKFRSIRFGNIAIRSLGKVEKLLNCEPREPNEPMPHPANNFKHVSLSKELLNEAFKKYRKIG